MSKQEFNATGPKDGNWFYQALLFFALTLISRIPFRSHYLFDHDSVQFALGMRQYDVYLHQPHPPGYFLYIQSAKWLDYFIGDANASLVWLSVLASAFTVVAIYCLSSAIYDQRDGRWVALLTITSPLVWFHSEVALTYIFAALFSTLVALIAWKLLQGERRWLYAAPLVLGISAGFRQDLLLFLGPLWLFAVARFGWRATLSAILVLIATIALWFLPMVSASGGLDRYVTALRELWAFNNDPQSIWQTTTSSAADTFWTLIGFLSYGAALGTIFLLVAAYLLVRAGEWRTVATVKLWFFILWLAPALAFFTFVFIPPYKHSYGLVVVPAFIILIPGAIRRIAARMARHSIMTARNLYLAPHVILPALVLINLVVFCFASEGFSVAGLRRHEKLIATIISGIKNNFPTENTLILGRQRSTFSGFRHVQYYLPEYSVYHADQGTNRRGEKGHAFGARRGQTVLSRNVVIAPDVRYVVLVADPYFPESSKDLLDSNTPRIRLSHDYTLYYKDLSSRPAAHAAPPK